MSEEQNVQTEEKKCKSSLILPLLVVTMVCSLATFILMLVGIISGGNIALPKAGDSAPAPKAQHEDNGPEVVISKQYDRGRSLAKARATKKPIVVFFYTDWCGFCQRFAPTFDKITKDREIKNKFAIAFVNCEKEENQKDMQDFGVQGFPTVFVIKKDGSKTQLENNTFFHDDSVKVVKEKMLSIIK